MRNPESLRTIKKLLEKPFFTSAEVKALGVHPSVLSHYVKTNQLERVRRGVYRALNAPELHSPWADLVEAVKGLSGGVICLTSALAIYSLTEEIPRAHWIAVANTTSAKAKRPVKIIRMRNIRLGQTKMTIDGVTIKIFDRERTIVDAFRELSKETAIKALKVALTDKTAQKIDLRKLQKYAKALHVNIAPYLMAVTT